MTLLTRLPDVIVAGLDSVIEDIRPWHNVPEANPAVDLRNILEEHGARSARLGIELDAYGLTGLHYTRVQAASPISESRHGKPVPRDTIQPW